jgi:hypothetical protein
VRLQIYVDQRVVFINTLTRGPLASVGAALKEMIAKHGHGIVLPIDLSICNRFQEFASGIYPEINLSKVDGAYYDVRKLVTEIIKVVVETPTINCHLTWLRDSHEKERVLHFVFAWDPDGHPMLKTVKSGATSAPVELLNLGKSGHLSDLSPHF